MPTSKSSAPEIVPAAEANRRFSELLRGVREEGRRFIVTSHGRAVAKLTPVEETRDDEAELRAAVLRERREAHKRLMEHLRAQPVLNLGKFNRDDAYDD